MSDDRRVRAQDQLLVDAEGFAKERGLGVAVMGIAVVCGGMVAIRANGGGYHWTLFDGTRWALVGGLAALGLLMTWSPRFLRAPVAGAGFVVAAQLAGSGPVAYRHWLPLSGAGAGSVGNLTTLKAAAVVLTVFGGLAAAICLYLLRAELRRADLQRAVARGAQCRTAIARGILAVVGTAAIAVLLPPALGTGNHENMDRTSLIGYAALYSVPWGVSLGLAAIVVRRSAVAIALAVAVSSLVDLTTNGMLDMTNPRPVFWGTAALALLVATARVALRPARGLASGAPEPT